MARRGRARAGEPGPGRSGSGRPESRGHLPRRRVASVASGGLVDGAAILAVIAINAAIGYATESRVARILASLNEVGVPMAFVRRHGRELLLARVELVPGDVMLLRPGHDVPADGRLIGVAGLQTNESALTGEGRARHRDRALAWPDTPELAIGVRRDTRGLGIGRRLLMALAEHAAVQGYPTGF